jgi:hypothetical protein
MDCGGIVEAIESAPLFRHQVIFGRASIEAACRARPCIAAPASAVIRLFRNSESTQFRDRGSTDLL